jgi:hypothetical protein
MFDSCSRILEPKILTAPKGDPGPLYLERSAVTPVEVGFWDSMRSALRGKHERTNMHELPYDLANGARDVGELKACLQSLAALFTHWTDIPYNPANFSASGGMNWVMPNGAGDVSNFGYKITADEMTMEICAANTTFSGPPGDTLFLPIPAGRRAAGGAYGLIQLIENALPNGTTPRTYGCVSAAPGATKLSIYRCAGGVFTPSTGNNWVLGRMVFRLQPEA